MRARRSLITGGGGQLGRDLARLLPESVAMVRSELSIENQAAVRDAIRGTGAGLVYNCAAYNAVDRAEIEPEPAIAINAMGAANVARACRLEGARLIHFSTNFVFDGLSDRPYTEDDRPKPLSAYGRSKLDGENRVLEELPTALVIRSAGLFGVGGSAVKGGSLPDRLLARAESGEGLAVVADQTFNPTFTGHLAEASIAAAERGLEGVLHLVAEGCCSIHEFAVEVLRLAEMLVEVEPINTSLGGAARPRNGCLSSVRGEPLPHWHEGLAAYWNERKTRRLS